jgi:uncharacterized membrane protein YgaE (UPF0421/DUF939 family)
MPASSPEPLSLHARLVLGARHALMTASAAWISYATTSLIGLREGFWAAISAIVVLQTDFTDTENSAWDRFIGTAIGGLIGWACGVYWHGHMWIYAVAIGLTIFGCWLANVSNAGRLAAVTVTIIVLIPQSEAVWRIALFRTLEVSWGIAVAIVIAWLAARLTTQGRE